MAPDDNEIQRIVRQVLAPLVTADGGELYVFPNAAGDLCLHLAGKFSGCPGTALAAHEFIHRAFETVDPALQVTVTSGPLLPPQAERIC